MKIRKIGPRDTKRVNYVRKMMLIDLIQGCHKPSIYKKKKKPTISESILKWSLIKPIMPAPYLRAMPARISSTFVSVQ